MVKPSVEKALQELHDLLLSCTAHFEHNAHRDIAAIQAWIKKYHHNRAVILQLRENLKDPSHALTQHVNELLECFFKFPNERWSLSELSRIELFLQRQLAIDHPLKHRLFLIFKYISIHNSGISTFSFPEANHFNVEHILEKQNLSSLFAPFKGEFQLTSHLTAKIDEDTLQKRIEGAYLLARIGEVFHHKKGLVKALKQALQELSETKGFETHPLYPVFLNAAHISSQKIVRGKKFTLVQGFAKSKSHNLVKGTTKNFAGGEKSGGATGSKRVYKIGNKKHLSQLKPSHYDSATPMTHIGRIVFKDRSDLLAEVLGGTILRAVTLNNPNIGNVVEVPKIDIVINGQTQVPQARSRYVQKKENESDMQELRKIYPHTNPWEGKYSGNITAENIRSCPGLFHALAMSAFIGNQDNHAENFLQFLEGKTKTRTGMIDFGLAFNGHLNKRADGSVKAHSSPVMNWVNRVDTNIAMVSFNHQLFNRDVFTAPEFMSALREVANTLPLTVIDAQIETTLNQVPKNASRLKECRGIQIRLGLPHITKTNHPKDDLRKDLMRYFILSRSSMLKTADVIEIQNIIAGNLPVEQKFLAIEHIVQRTPSLTSDTIQWVTTQKKAAPTYLSLDDYCKQHLKQSYSDWLVDARARSLYFEQLRTEVRRSPMQEAALKKKQLERADLAEHAIIMQNRTALVFLYHSLDNAEQQQFDSNMASKPRVSHDLHLIKVLDEINNIILSPPIPHTSAGTQQKFAHIKRLLETPGPDGKAISYDEIKSIKIKWRKTGNQLSNERTLEDFCKTREVQASFEEYLIQQELLTHFTHIQNTLLLSTFNEAALTQHWLALKADEMKVRALLRKKNTVIQKAFEDCHVAVQKKIDDLKAGKQPVTKSLYTTRINLKAAQVSAGFSEFLIGYSPKLTVSKTLASIALWFHDLTHAPNPSPRKLR